MTKEEIIDNIARLNSETWRDREEVRTEIGKLLAELKKALEQQPSGDCVSRADLLKMYENRFIELQKAHQKDKQLGVNWCINILKEMPPVTPAHCIAAVRFSKDDLREICNERIEIECTHGTCKDCINHGISKEYTDMDGARYCSSFRTYTGYDFYCKDFEKRGNEND